MFSLCKANEDTYAEGEEYGGRYKNWIIPFLRNIYFAINPFYDLHRRESHKHQHHNRKDKGKDNIYHDL